MKAFTDIEQSKKLAEILPIESADMHYCFNFDLAMDKWWRTIPNVTKKDNHFELYPHDIPCWSLAALLDQLEDVIVDKNGYLYKLEIIKEGVQYYLVYEGMLDAASYDTPLFDNLVDAAVEMIYKLKEKDLL